MHFQIVEICLFREPSIDNEYLPVMKASDFPDARQW